MGFKNFLPDFELAGDPDSHTGVAMKDTNRRRKIISHLSERGESTLNELSDLLNISIPKTTELINAMEETDLVMVSGRRSLGPGRKASIYQLAPQSYYFLGIEIKKYSINFGILAFDRNLIHFTRDIPFLFENADEALPEILKGTREFITQSGVAQGKIAGIGISISGRVNTKTGEILTFDHFGDAPIKNILETNLGIPVFLDNDSRALAYGEYHFGNKKNEKEVLVLNLDYGLALGIFIKGKPVYGISGYAGELGHIPMFDNEIICFCGKKGCLETEASGRALIAHIIKEMEAGSNSLLYPVYKEKGRLEIEDVLAAIGRGDNLSLSAIGSIAAKLGRGLAVAINLFNPELIIISGLLSRVGDALLLPIKSFILRHSLSIVNADTRVELSELGENAGLLGCCLLVRDKMLGLV